MEEEKGDTETANVKVGADDAKDGPVNLSANVNVNAGADVNANANGTGPSGLNQAGNDLNGNGGDKDSGKEGDSGAGGGGSGDDGKGEGKGKGWGKGSSNRGRLPKDQHHPNNNNGNSDSNNGNKNKNNGHVNVDDEGFEQQAKDGKRPKTAAEKLRLAKRRLNRKRNKNGEGCFICSDPNHKSYDCPKNKNKNKNKVSPPPPRTTPLKAPAAPSVTEDLGEGTSGMSGANLNKNGNDNSNPAEGSSKRKRETTGNTPKPDNKRARIAGNATDKGKGKGKGAQQWRYAQIPPNTWDLVIRLKSGEPIPPRNRNDSDEEDLQSKIELDVVRESFPLIDRDELPDNFGFNREQFGVSRWHLVYKLRTKSDRKAMRRLVFNRLGGAVWDRVEVVDAETLVVMTNKLSGLINIPYTPSATQMYTRLIRHAVENLKGNWEMKETRRAPSGTIIEINVDNDMMESLAQEDFTIRLGLAGLVRLNATGKKMAHSSERVNKNDDDKASTVGGDLTHTFECIGLGEGAGNEKADKGMEVMDVQSNPDDYLLESTDDDEEDKAPPKTYATAVTTTTTTTTTTAAARVARAAAAATLAVAAAAAAKKV